MQSMSYSVSRLVKEALDKVDNKVEEEKEELVEEKNVVVEEASSEFFLVGDLVDVMDIDPDSGTPGAWYVHSLHLLLGRNSLSLKVRRFYCTDYEGGG